MSSPELCDANSIDPISILENMSIFDVTPKDIQAALNHLEPGGKTAPQDAEVILGIAAHASALNPTDIDLDELVDRSRKLFDREQSPVNGVSVPEQPFKYPETAEEESRRVGAYFRNHSLARTNRTKDTYGDEDSSLPDRPHGDY